MSWGKRQGDPLFQARITRVSTQPMMRMCRKISPSRRLFPSFKQSRGVRKQRSAGGSTRSKTAYHRPENNRLEARHGEKFQLLFPPGAGARQSAGSDQFELPNRYLVYLHGTPDTWLFGSSTRTFSHGCVRVEKPMELALSLLDDGSGKLQARETREGRHSRPLVRSLALPKAVPIFFSYWTAWVDETGRLQFRPDVYGWDSRDPETFAGLSGLKNNGLKNNPSFSE